MKKPAQLREVIEKAYPYLRNNPDRLQIFIDDGHIIATNATSLSYEYQYTLNIIITDFDKDMAIIIVPLLAYLRKNQNELFDNPAKRQDTVAFETDLINQTTQDLSLKIKLTERVKVEQTEKGTEITYLPEPIAANETLERLELYIKDEFITSADGEHHG
ncbi:phage tail protein [Gallibacterium genomosp. 1]|uniref:Tail protein n=1 Tax=Gallibacterium genomosp. 1 TaxID=155515 RepID=A0A0A2XWM3_9PAST|nr:phage tail protein [Gallibacterium genomosp. 1]KGQ36806.1 tail protein [Gallibacterium genomosp. 1]